MTLFIKGTPFYGQIAQKIAEMNERATAYLSFRNIRVELKEAAIYTKDSLMEKKEFSGNIFIFQAFDVGDDFDLETVEKQRILDAQPVTLPKYFKNYHPPLSVKLPNQPSTYFSSKLEDFGALSLIYKIPFNESFDALRKHVTTVDMHYQQKSIADAQIIFNETQKFITKPNFFHLRTSFIVIQLDVKSGIDAQMLKEEYGHTIASLIRLETDTLSDYQRKEILKDAVSYYRGELVVIDSEAAFVYDNDYIDLFPLFEFNNIQHLELQYFDQLLAKRLNDIYERKTKLIRTRQFIPFMSLPRNPVAELGILKVDISVITEQLQSNIMLANEPYLTEIYGKLVEKLDLEGWKKSINSKLVIIKEISSVYYNRLETIRAEVLEVLIIILIFIEIVLGIFK